MRTWGDERIHADNRTAFLTETPRLLDRFAEVFEREPDDQCRELAANAANAILSVIQEHQPVTF